MCSFPQNVNMGPDGKFDGMFSANGVYEVTVGKINYTVVTDNFTIDCSFNNTEDCSTCKADFPVKIEQLTCDKVKFVVVVRDQLTQKPIEGAEVVVTQGKEFVPQDVSVHTTNDKGEIEIIGMPKGEFDIVVTAEHYDEKATSTGVDCDVYHCEACLPVVAVELPHTINPCPGVPFTIAVSNNDTGLPLEGAFVTLTRDDGTGSVVEVLDKVLTKPNGQISVDVTNNATFEILVTKPYYDSVKIVDAELCCDMSDITCLECSLTQPILLSKIQCPASTLTVMVNDSYTTDPIPEATVSITLAATPEEVTEFKLLPTDFTSVVGTVKEFTTDKNGIAVTDVAEMADYNITITHPDYEPMTVKENIDCPIDACGSCHHVTDANPRKKPPVCDKESKFVILIEYTDQKGEEVPLPDAIVKLELLSSTNSHSGQETTDENGLVTPEVRYDGTYRIVGLCISNSICNMTSVK